jgi:hypothetical protein
MKIDLFNFVTNMWDELDIDCDADEHFDYSEYVGNNNLARNLYQLNRLNGNDSLPAAIMTMESQL